MSKNTPQVITCKAVVCWGADDQELVMEVEEIEVEAPRSSEVRIKMLCASLCHTDIMLCKGRPFPLYPRVPGHEGVGIVESVGDGVEDFKEGDFVIPTFIGECQQCENCISDKTNLCYKYPLSMSGLMLDGTSRMSVKGQKLYQLFSCSTWSEYTVVNTNYVVKIDPCIPFEHASLMSCGFSTGYGATWKEVTVEKGSSVAVFGLGAVGLGAVEGARIAGADQIIGIDKNRWKKSKGEALGMTDFIDANDSGKPISELIKDLTGGIGVDYCFECTGVANLIDEAVLSIKMGKGKVVMVGAGYGAKLEVSYRPFLFGGTMKGSLFGGIKVKSDLPAVLDKCKNKEFHLEELLTHEVSLEDFKKAFESLKRSDCVKVAIKF